MENYTNVNWPETTGAKLYRHAKEIMPGGTQLLSKRPEMFLPDQWPAYYTHAKGIEVWDMDGRRFLDFSITGIGATLLGYADEDVNSAVKTAVDKGSLTTLNCPEEVELAELLCEIHPWADMVRYTRTGGETMAVAVRIARAKTGKDKIALCGYHGWHDWYLAANLSSGSSLEGHLLPGLEPAGVPKGLTDSVLPFRYNHIEEFQAAVDKHGDEIGAIVMEPMRYDMPKDGFLHKVREIADKIGAILIFDEITIGWRCNYGGMHLELGVTPDIACFAKSISNGFPMGAVIGKADVMQAAQNSFISSTYWTEAVGLAATLATLRKMKRVNLADHVRKIGQMIQAGWRELADKHGINISIIDPPALAHFSFDEAGDQAGALNTLFTQCMLERGFLAKTVVYVTYAHSEELVKEYLDAVDQTFEIIAQAITKKDAISRLNGEVAHSGFQRLT